MARVLKVTAKGQLTLRREVLRHLGVSDGAGISVELLPGGRAELRAATAEGSIEDFFGCLPPAEARLTIDEIGDLASQGWAGVHEDHRRHEPVGAGGGGA